MKFIPLKEILSELKTYLQEKQLAVTETIPHSPCRVSPSPSWFSLASSVPPEPSPSFTSPLLSSTPLQSGFFHRLEVQMSTVGILKTQFHVETRCSACALRSQGWAASLLLGSRSTCQLRLNFEPIMYSTALLSWKIDPGLTNPKIPLLSFCRVH